MKTILWILVIILGAIISTKYIPNGWLYVFGFFVGAMAQAIISS